MLYNKRFVRFTAKVMLVTLILELAVPAVSSALTTGPSQPEVQGFEPVGTTDMVDMFSGDFVYNIPLMDVEGYPVNISYHGGVDMEQEASWVGLGWNINPGVINRTVRGMPDDFNGQMITKTLSIKDEKNVRVGLGVGAEFAGVGTPILGLSADINMSVNVSNYKGVSADLSLAAGVNVARMASAGINLGVGSQNGADIDYNVGLNFNISQIIGSDISAGVGVTYGSGYNTRSGLKDRTIGLNINAGYKGYGGGVGLSSSVPIGVKNIIPVVTNRSHMVMFRGQIKLGGELYSVYPHAAVFGMVSKLSYDKDGSRPGYGYLYAQNADDTAIQDFTRDRDGMFNETMNFLPLGNMTYDIYSVSGQGTGGSFRPFRNDFGSVGDPVVTSNNEEYALNIEAGIGNLVEFGTDGTLSTTEISSGPWDAYKRPFTKQGPGSTYENIYFKQAGEATIVNPGLMEALQGTNPMDGLSTASIPVKKPYSDTQRDARGNLIYYFTGDEASTPGVASSVKLKSYDAQGFAGGADVDSTVINRNTGDRKGNYISEVVQVQTDGRRYIYGIAAMNNSQDEVTFATTPSSNASGLTTFGGTDATENNGNGRDHFFSKTSTPAYAHSYLLTSVLSADYVDVKGDGPTDDDFGSFTKFNYSRKNNSYGWKAPYGAGVAQYNPAFKSDKLDDRASYLSGSREQWLMHSIETKNFVAEFYTSDRLDGRGINSTVDLSYKLDSIKLYNKHDRFINKTTAVPVKTVIFQYDYSLCQNVANNIHVINNPNAVGDTTGKLTLRRIFIRYGNSDKSMISPYRFDYAHNFPYNIANKDRWGAFKPNGTAVTNADFPYTDQSSPAAVDSFAAAWSLDTISLPSGGKIKVYYEADDYAFVQNRPAMEMFTIRGTGNSPNFSGGNQLFINKNSPNLYFYFDRRPGMEKPGLSFEQNYIGDQKILYYNLDTRLVDNNYEPIKGYADIDKVDSCPDGVHGYVKIKPVEIEGGGALIHHGSYTAINFARFYLPHIIFPGSDPDASGLTNILSGIKYAFSELVSFSQNPVKRMIEEGKAKEVKLSSSFIRLNNPGLRKKGGGQRVKKIEFYDNWSRLAGGNAQNATYGKTYDYTTEDAGSYGSVSSGVASYEPQIGGDENPFRLPVNYEGQSGGSFPPHDPIGLYQEMPVGESLYPGAMVGYSRVTVKSIHQLEGKSSQGMDVYDFYTARDFPIQAIYTAMNKSAPPDEFSFTEQKQMFEGSQGYTLIFNDMHGKPKRTEHRIIKSLNGMTELVSYQQYIYNTEGGKLSNKVPVIEYDRVTGRMKKVDKEVGIEADITIDTRQKKEYTHSNTAYLSTNIFLVGVIPIPLFFFYMHPFNFRNEFRSVVATKVVQQYGILKEVQSSQEGALTIVRNEAFDPVTGQALITSVNNEYKDREYSVSYPAYWGYKSMGPSYVNTGYVENFQAAEVTGFSAELPTGATFSNYRVGDELLISYNYNGSSYTNNVWVMGFKYPGGNPDCGTYIPPDSLNFGYIAIDTFEHYDNVSGFPHPIVKPRFKHHESWPGQSVNGNGTLNSVRIKVIRSGAKNQLGESIQSYTGMDIPFDNNNFLKDKLERLISISAKEYSDTLTAILPKYDSLLNPTTFDSLNIYVNGTRQIKRISKEYAYMKSRNYTGAGVRTTGLFSALSFWLQNPPSSSSNIEWYCYEEIPCEARSSNPIEHAVLAYTHANALACLNVHHHHTAVPSPNSLNSSYFSPHPQDDPSWLIARSVTKYSPWGFELENKDAIGNYTAAMYAYNQLLPAGIAQNAEQHEMFTEGFEDFQLLQVVLSKVGMSFSPFGNLFDIEGITGSSKYIQFDLPGTGGLILSNSFAHTGIYSLKVNGAQSFDFKVETDFPTAGQPRYLPFTMKTGKRYLVSYWFRPHSPTSTATGYQAPSGMQLKSNIIEEWQQVERFIEPSSTGVYTLTLPGNSYVDDIRILPADANMKAFVYHPVNQRLIATLDENNFASFYEYDQEGNLVRTKKETEKGIITVMESRSANAKAN